MNAPIIWLSKNHNTVEISTFISEFMAVRIAIYLIVALFYKLNMFGGPLDGPSDVMFDNQGVVNKEILPQSTFSKKHIALKYYVIRKADATGILQT